MDKFFILKLAFRNLNQHRLRAILTLLGVIIGVSAIVFLVSFAFGIERLVTNEISSGNAFLLIDVGTGDSQLVSLNNQSVENIQKLPNVRSVFGSTAIGAKAVTGDKTMDVSFYGVDSLYLFKSGVHLKEGIDLPKSGNVALVNTAYLDFWSRNNKGSIIDQEAQFDLVVPKELSGKDSNTVFEGQKYKVIGIIDDNSSPKVYTTKDSLNQLGVTDYSQLKVEILSQDQAPEVRKLIENMGFKTQYVGDTVSQINQVFGIFRAILAAFGLVTLIVAILGMFNTLTISLLERIKEIALMKMLGMKKRDINNIFLTESVILGLSGGVFGLILALLVEQVVNIILNHYAKSLGGQVVSIFYSPLNFIFAIVIISILVGLLTGLYPARRAVKVNALDVLRYE